MQQHVESHRDGHELAVQALVACAACGHEIPRKAMSCPYCGTPGPESRTPRIARKRRSITKCILGGLMMLAAGLSFFYIAFPFNLVVGPTALILGAATASVWQCGRCHAQVDRDAVECPRCALPFSL